MAKFHSPLSNGALKRDANALKKIQFLTFIATEDARTNVTKTKELMELLILLSVTQIVVAIQTIGVILQLRKE